MKPSTYRPRLFIGSSSEGLKVARAAKDLLSENTLPTLWEEDIFLPGTITLEVLEEQLAKHAFALLVATPDDLLLKRQEVVTTLRDNVLFECGLFMGALGRRRTFLFAPKGTHIELPTDLRGLAIAKYTWSKSAPHDSLRPAIKKVILAMEAEWRRMQRDAREFAQKERLGEQHHAIMSLLSASNHLLDVVIEHPRDVISGLHDRDAFERAKRKAIAELREISRLWLRDAQVLNIERDFLSLVSQLEATIEAIPFYRDLEIVTEPKVVVGDLPFLKRIFRRRSSHLSPEAQAFATRLKLRDKREFAILRATVTYEEQAVEQQVEHALRLLGTGLENWWKNYGQKSNCGDPSLSTPTCRHAPGNDLYLFEVLRYGRSSYRFLCSVTRHSLNYGVSSASAVCFANSRLTRRFSDFSRSNRWASVRLPASGSE